MSASAAPTDAVSEVARPGGAFSRQASGLIRIAGSWDVFIYNVGLVSVGIAIAFNQYYGPSLYPGAEPAIATLLAALGMCAVAATFYFWSVIFPRSGGVYVFLSRTTSSSLAFVFTVLETVILLYYGALAASYIVQVGLASFFATVGSIGGSNTLVRWAGDVSKPTGVFWIGTAFLVAAGLLLATGTRRYFTVQRVLFAVALFATAVTALVMLFGSRASFQDHLQSLTGLKYDGVIRTAESKGYASASGIDWGETAKFLIWPLLPLLGAIQSVGIGGEVKKVRSAQLVGMLGAVVGTGALIALFAVLSDKAFGYTFQGAISFNSLSGITDASTEGSIGAAPYFTTLAGILANNVILATIIMAAFVAWFWFWVPAEIAYATRTMIAWSFDKLAPDGLGYVSRRFHTPVVAIAIGTAGSIAFMWLIAFHGIALLTLIEALLVIWGTAMVAAIVFPWTGRRFYDASPVKRLTVAGIPLMSITAAISTAFFVLAFVLLWRDPNAAGPLFDSKHVTTEFWIVLGTVVAASAWYVGNKLYRRSQGVDIDLAFKQIPIE
jgi:basic amino acid/polyamine antiporter, APA family